MTRREVQPQVPIPTRGLPTCIPVTWETADGQYLLAYPRSPYDPHRYLIARCRPARDQQTLKGDTLAVVDDFGNLVETHVRGELFFRPMARSAG
jgi:hypothetical protein